MRPGTTACAAPSAASLPGGRRARRLSGLAAGGRSLRAPGFRDAWRAVQCIESHDEVYRDRGLRIPRLAVGDTDTRSWYATSRSRVATGLLLTAPGIPMLFMGQEFYEDKRWADDPPNHKEALIWWDGLATDKTMIDFHRFTRDLIWLRRRQPACAERGSRTVSMENGPRVLVFQRWVEGVGRDVMVVASLNERTLHGYRSPCPAPAGGSKCSTATSTKTGSTRLFLATAGPCTPTAGV